jgi:hypothetical protein
MKQSLINKIENLFEPEMILEQFSFLQEKSNFKTEDHFEWIENISYFKTDNDLNNQPDWSIYFSRLMPFFEFGLMFQDEKLFLSFFKGQCHNLTASVIKIKIPASPLFKIYKTDCVKFLKKIKIDHMTHHEKWSCYYIRVSQNIGFVVFTDKAEPWSKLMMESLQKSMINFSV